MRTLGLRLPPHHDLGAHRHDWPQLVHVSGGGLALETELGSWIVPPTHLAYLPAGLEHDLRTNGPAHLRSVYLRPDLAVGLPDTCRVLLAAPLLRELIFEAMRRHRLAAHVPDERRLARVLVDQLATSPEAPFRVDLPRDRRARRVADAVRTDPARRLSVTELARGSGASARTIERLFVRETGRSFGNWSQRVRALHALERLAAGDSVTQAGLAIGYASTSAFIAMFRRAFGTTPGRHASG